MRKIDDLEDYFKAENFLFIKFLCVRGLGFLILVKSFCYTLTYIPDTGFVSIQDPIIIFVGWVTWLYFEGEVSREEALLHKMAKELGISDDAEM